MSQHAARHDQRAKSAAEDDGPQVRQPSGRPGVRLRRPVARPAGDDGVSPDGPAEPVGPDEPDEGEFELIGGDDLGAADLGPAAPDARDPDAGSGRIRKFATS